MGERQQTPRFKKKKEGEQSELANELKKKKQDN
jgi:hypothetical protein